MSNKFTYEFKEETFLTTLKTLFNEKFILIDLPTSNSSVSILLEFNKKLELDCYILSADNKKQYWLATFNFLFKNFLRTSLYKELNHKLNDFYYFIESHVFIMYDTNNLPTDKLKLYDLDFDVIAYFNK